MSKMQLAGEATLWSMVPSAEFSSWNPSHAGAPPSLHSSICRQVPDWFEWSFTSTQQALLAVARQPLIFAARRRDAGASVRRVPLALSHAQRCIASELLQAAMPERATVVALDGTGKSQSSEGFARRLGRWRDDGIADLAFMIGGANGLHGDLVQKAQLTLSLGAMTWPHLLARAMLMEQLYRAHTILSGHPYHRA